MELKIDDVSLYYGKTAALSHVSSTLISGGLIGLVGPNGAGKTSLMRLLATLTKPDEGDILLDGTSILKKPSAMREVIGYLPQQAAVYPNLSAKEFLSYMAAVKGIPSREAKKQVGELLSFFHLTDTGKKPLAAFSGGMRQRVGIAAALLGDPRVIFTDEPTAGLDPQERVSLRNLLSELATQRIVLLSTHIVSDIEAAATHLLVLHRGKKAFEGTPGNLIKRAQGRVWETFLEQGQSPPKEWHVSSLAQTGEGMRVRVIGEEKPLPDAFPASPTLEDACLASFTEVTDPFTEVTD